MVLPDVTSIKTRYPEFETVPDALVAFAIEEAARMVDETWLERDRIPALSAAAAHYMAVAGASAGVDGREVVSETIGPISVTYAGIAAAAAASPSSFVSSAYGKTFSALLRRNHGGPITVS
jgi:Protein of unknown function (DUF4054)